MEQSLHCTLWAEQPKLHQQWLSCRVQWKNAALGKDPRRGAGTARRSETAWGVHSPGRWPGTEAETRFREKPSPRHCPPQPLLLPGRTYLGFGVQHRFPELRLLHGQIGTRRHWPALPLPAQPTLGRARKINFHAILDLTQSNISFRIYRVEEKIGGEKGQDAEETSWRTNNLQDVASPTVGKGVGSSVRKRKVTVPGSERLHSAISN